MFTGKMKRESKHSTFKDAQADMELYASLIPALASAAELTPQEAAASMYYEISAQDENGNETVVFSTESEMKRLREKFSYDD